MLVKFGKHFKQIRISKNLTQLDVAAKANLDRNYIGMVERGERNPSLLSLYKLAKGLSVNLKELMDFDYE